MENTSNPDKLNILFEDTHIIVCKKPHGLATQSSRSDLPDLESLIKNHIKMQGHSKGIPYLAVIHRLDQPVAGIMVFAKTPFAAKELNRQLQNQGFGKYYRALVSGTPTPSENTLENYIIKDAKTNISRICSAVTPGAKLARLHYQIVRKGQGYFNWGRVPANRNTSPIEPIEIMETSELEIHLDTGRHHQIRVQLAHIGCPIAGDTKYNGNCTAFPNLMLSAYRLSFSHPKTKKEMVFSLL